jgi:hypothetical protein
MSLDGGTRNDVARTPSQLISRGAMFKGGLPYPRPARRSANLRQHGDNARHLIAEARLLPHAGNGTAYRAALLPASRCQGGATRLLLADIPQFAPRGCLVPLGILRCARWCGLTNKQCCDPIRAIARAGELNGFRHWRSSAVIVRSPFGLSSKRRAAAG